ncbi:MAG: HypC/HybG/HupF family hydrogenase formation chaperone [bacterium]
MCLAIPGRVLSVSEEGPLARRARVDFGGIVRETNLSFLPEAVVGDWVLVHVGVALTRMDMDEARRIFDDLRRAGVLAEEGL